MKKAPGTLTLKIFFIIVITDVVESFGQLFFKKSTIATGIESVGIHNLLDFVLQIVPSPYLWLGVLCYVLNFFFWMAVLSRLDLSVAFPSGSTCYVFVPLLSVIFLNEKVFFLRWVGVICILIGIYFLSQSTHNNKAQSNDC